jgi:hypothetical protein
MKLLGIGLGLVCAVLVIDAASVRRRWRRCDSRLLHRNPLKNRNEPPVDVPVEAIELHDGPHYICFARRDSDCRAGEYTQRF